MAVFSKIIWEIGMIIEDYVGRIIEDSLHTIWIGTTEGMSRYDIEADTFYSFYWKTRR